MNPHGHLALSVLLPFIETVSGNNTAASIDEGLKGRQFRQCFGTNVNHSVADTRICGPMRNQPPVHEPAFVLVPVPDDDGNRRGSLFRSDVKARCVLWQIAVKVPANPDVTKLECSCESATHFEGTVALYWGWWNQRSTLCRLLRVGPVSGL